MCKHEADSFIHSFLSPGPRPERLTPPFPQRSKHLKCDGATPCARCLSAGTGPDCIYVASRRGYKGPRRGTAPHNPHKRHASSSPDAAGGGDNNNGNGNGNNGGGQSCPMLLGAGGGSSAPLPPPSMTAASSIAGTPYSGSGGAAHHHTPPGGGTAAAGSASFNLSAAAASLGGHLQVFKQPPFAAAHPLDAIQQAHHHHHYGNHALPSPSMAAPAVTSVADKCLDSFYYHYHAAHPFVLPKAFLLRHIRGCDSGGSGSGSGSGSGGGHNNNNINNNSNKLEHLLAAMRYVGSLYLDGAGAGPAKASFLDEALRLAHSPATPKDGFLVQALLLLIVALDGSLEQARARDLLGEAERLAVEIGLNTRQFAALHGRGNPVLEESWRRTWWDLYVCDGMVAGVHRVTNFLLYDVVADVALPCEEAEYLSGVSLR